MVEEAIAQENDGKTVITAADNEPKLLFSVEILRLIRDAQKQHGLRHGDYQRYRGLYIKYEINSLLVHQLVHYLH